MGTPIVEADVSQSMLRRVKLILERAELIANQRPEDVAKLTEAEQAARLVEIEQATARAAEIMAKYGIDRAMAASFGLIKDGTVDEVIMSERPFAEKMRTLLYVIADSMGAKTRYIKTWNKDSGPKAKGGVPRGGYDYGVRIFAYESDLERIKIMYASLRNQALAGVKGVVNRGTTFGQAQKADRESYLDGWTSGLYRKMQQIEREAQERAEAEEQERRDKAMMGEGEAVKGPGVAIVLADRRTALDLAWDLAQGITPEMRVQWAKNDEEYRQQAETERERKAKEIEDCKKCQKAKSGRCNEHKVRYGRSNYRSYERTGTRFSDGFQDGQKADLGVRDPQVGNDTRSLA